MIVRLNEYMKEKNQTKNENLKGIPNQNSQFTSLLADQSLNDSSIGGSDPLMENSGIISNCVINQNQFNDYVQKQFEKQ